MHVVIVLVAVVHGDVAPHFVEDAFAASLWSVITGVLYVHGSKHQGQRTAAAIPCFARAAPRCLPHHACICSSD
jgi:hypothetical protein